MTVRFWRRVPLLALAALAAPWPLHAEAWRYVRSAPVGLASAVVEPLRHRLFVYGAWDQAGQFRDLWSLSLDSLAKWERVSAIGAGPGPRTNSVLFADPARDQIFAYGGREPSSPFVLSPGSEDDVWQMDLLDRPTWQRLDVVNGPGTYGPVYGSTSSAALDVRSGRLMAFGGVVSRNTMFRTSGTWQIDVTAPSSWAELHPATVPSPRAYAASAYDTVTNRLVVTGGTIAGDTWMTDTWSRSSPDGAWQQLSAASGPPVANRELSWVRTGARKLDILNGTTLYTLDLSQTDVAAWSSQPIVDETGRELGRYAWDESTQSVWAIDPNTADLFRLTLTGYPAWELAMPAPIQPRPLYGGNIVFDPTSDRTWMLFGFDLQTFSLATSGVQAKGSRLDDWSVFTVGPSAREGASVVLDDANRRLLVFGGVADTTYLADLWEYRIDAQTWAPISAAGGGPSPRHGHSAVIDSTGRRMIVFGGETSVPGGGSQTLSDMWALSLDGSPTWTRLEDAPVQRRSHSAIWDAPRGRMLVVSGAASSGDRDNGDVWEWVPGRVPAWQQGPWTRYPLYGSTEVIHDPQHDVLLMIGQNDPNYAYLRVEPLDLATLEWNASLTDESTPPIAGPAYYDRVRRQGVMIQSATAWTLPLGPPAAPETSLLAADGSAGQAVVEWRVVGDPQPLRVRRFRAGSTGRARTFDGIVPNAGGVVRLVDRDVAPGDTLYYALEADVDGDVRQFGVANVRVIESPPGPSLVLSFAVHPISPALTKETQVRCSLPDAAPTRLEVFDLTGRRLVDMEIGSRGPGEFTVTLPRRFNAGLYFVRLKRAGADREARLVVLP